MSSSMAHKMLRIGEIVAETCLICKLIENKRKEDALMSMFANEIRADCNILLHKAVQIAIKNDLEDEKELKEILEKVQSLESQCNHYVKVIHKNGHSLFV